MTSNSSFFKHHHWFLWISLAWHSIKNRRKGFQGRYIGASYGLPMTLPHPVWDDLTMVSTEFELGLKELSWVSSISFQLRIHVFQNIRSSLLSNMIRSYLLSALGTFSTTNFCLLKGHYFLLFGTSKWGLPKANNQDIWHYASSDGGHMRISLFRRAVKDASLR